MTGEARHSVAEWTRRCGESSARSRGRRAQPSPFPWKLVAVALTLCVWAAALVMLAVYLFGPRFAP